MNATPSPSVNFISSGENIATKVQLLISTWPTTTIIDSPLPLQSRISVLFTINRAELSSLCLVTVEGLVQQLSYSRNTNQNQPGSVEFERLIRQVLLPPLLIVRSIYHMCNGQCFVDPLVSKQRYFCSSERGH